VPGGAGGDSLKRRAHGASSSRISELAPAAASIPPDRVVQHRPTAVLLLRCCSRSTEAVHQPRHGHGGGHCRVANVLLLCLAALAARLSAEERRGKAPPLNASAGRLKKAAPQPYPHAATGRSGEPGHQHEDRPAMPSATRRHAAADPEAIHADPSRPAGRSKALKRERVERCVGGHWWRRAGPKKQAVAVKAGPAPAGIACAARTCRAAGATKHRPCASPLRRPPP